MKSKKLLFTFLFISCSILLFSKNIDRLTSEKVALNFFFERMNTFVNATNYNDLNITGSKFIDNAYYVVNFEKGWVLVSANDVMVPILGYDYMGSFPTKEQQSDNFKSWMQHFVDQVVFIKENNIESGEHNDKWEKYLTDDPKLRLNNNGLDEVEPLLTCTWHQNFPYNINCPEDPAGPGGYTFAGCGATVLTQIMHYWRYPMHGSGSNTYYCYPYGNQTANFAEATYEWDAMQNNIDYNNPWEIAEITYHVAVSLNMNFGPGGSGSNINSTPNALSNYFNSAAELSPGTLYLYFKNKEELHTSLSINILKHLGVEIKQVVDQDISVEEKIEKFRDVFIDVYDYDPNILINLFHLQSGETLQNLSDEVMQQLKKYSSQAHGAIIDVVKEGIDTGVFIDEHPVAMADVIWGSYAGVVLWVDSKRLLNDQKDFVRSTLRTTFKIILQGMKVK